MDKYLKTADSDWYKQRVTGVMICVLVAFTVLLLRLLYLQIVMGEEYLILSLNNRIRLQSIDPPRGLIYDRNNQVLVENRPSFDVSITLKDARPVEKTIDKLADVSEKFKQIDDPAPEQFADHLAEVDNLVEQIKLRGDRLALGLDTLAPLSAGGRDVQSKLPVLFATRAALDPVVEAALGSSLAELEAAIEEGDPLGCIPLDSSSASVFTYLLHFIAALVCR